MKVNAELPCNVKFYCDKIVKYYDYSYLTKGKPRHKNSLANLSDTNNYGFISRVAKSKITSYINYIVATSPTKKAYNSNLHSWFTFKVNFITLTLPSTQIHSDQQIKRECLTQFLTEIRKKSPDMKYFWRAEKQKNGNIHFHILTNQYYHYTYIRICWNRIIQKLGYVDTYSSSFTGISFESYKSKFKDTIKENEIEVLRRRWEKGTKEGWRNPNTTDVHSIRKIKNIAAYVSKYCSKNKEQNQLEKCEKVKGRFNGKTKYKLSISNYINLKSGYNYVTGQLYGSDDLTKKQSFYTTYDSIETYRLENEMEANYPYKFVNTDYFAILYLDVYKLVANTSNPLGRLIYNHFNYVPPLIKIQ